jgi:flavin-dependent dehydrogenase
LGGPDVVIVGAGPAGACAGLVLARAGARVRILDRATFPRDKLCGDTVNPGALARLRALGVADEIEARGLRVDGMLLTGERGVAVEGRYPDGVSGRAILRRDLDWILLQHAVAAGCDIEDGAAVRRALIEDGRGGRRVTGVAVSVGGRDVALSAPIVIAADGRHSTLSFGLGLARHPPHPRRWAIGAYFEHFAPAAPGTCPARARHVPGDPQVSDRCLARAGHVPGTGRVSDTSPTPVRHGSDTGQTLGEMHVRRGRYIGVAPVPGGLTNVCVVRGSGPADPELADPRALLARELARDPVLRDRAAGARLVTTPVVLGPLAVDAVPVTIDGLLLAGDAAGFIDPMTGDGLRFAVRGAELAASAALDVLAHGWTGAHARLAASRRGEFNGKWRFNRVLRALVGSPRALDAVTIGARVAPAVFRAVIAHAGDCDAAC